MTMAKEDPPKGAKAGEPEFDHWREDYDDRSFNRIDIGDGPFLALQVGIALNGRSKAPMNMVQASLAANRQYADKRVE